MEKKLFLDYLLRPHWPTLAIAFVAIFLKVSPILILDEIQFSDKAAAAAGCG